MFIFIFIYFLNIDKESIKLINNVVLIIVVVKLY